MRSGTCSPHGARGCSASGFLTGGYGEDELLAAGAFRVYRGADELLGAIDELGI